MRIPLFPLDLVLFPGTPLDLHIFEQRYKEMIGECMRDKRDFGIVWARQDGMTTIGSTASIRNVLRRYPDGRLDIRCCGEQRFEIESLYNDRSFFEAEVDLLIDQPPASTRLDREQCAALHMEMVELSGVDVRQFPQIDLDRPVVFELAAAIPAGREFQQEILQLPSEAARTRRLIAFYQAILPKLHRGALVEEKSAGNGYVM